MNFKPLFQELTPNVEALTTTVGFNVCYYAGADSAQVAADRARLVGHFGVTDEQLYVPRQTHTANVALAGEEPIDADVDALVSNRSGQVIGINTADCVPLLMADVAAGVIAAVHCGWRGTVAGIAEAAVARMVALGAAVERIHAAMGPCIGVECFEVGPEVAAQFPPEVVERRAGWGKPHVNLPLDVARRLRLAGLRAENIAMTQACSVCCHEFYSVRRQGREIPFRTFTAITLRR
jgi:hypothetical protein